MKLEQHPLSRAFPGMAEEEFQDLVNDINSHGQREPGVLYEGKVLDGWHRYLACEKAGIPFAHEELEGLDPVAYVVLKNLRRRHLNASQRAAAMVACSRWAPASRPQKDAAAAPFSTVLEMAKGADVSPRTITQAKKAHQAGLGEAVKEGKLSAERAAELADLPDEKRARALQGHDAPPKAKTRRENVGALHARIAELEAERDKARASLADMEDIAKATDAVEQKEEYRQIRALQAELTEVKRRRDELMNENAELKRDRNYWKQRAERAEKGVQDTREAA